MSVSSPRKGFLLASVVAGVLMASPGEALAKGIRLQYSDRVGEQVKYRMVMDAGASEADGTKDRTHTTLRSELVVSQEVLASKQGVSRVRTRVDSGSLKADGLALPLPALGQELVADIKRNGEILAATDFAGLDMKNMQVVFPERELAVNDSWTMTIAPSPAVPVALKITYTVAGMEMLGGEECVKIKASVVSDKAVLAAGVSLDMKSEGEMLFNPRLGRMMKNEMRSRTNLVRASGPTDKVVTRMSNHIRMESLP